MKIPHALKESVVGLLAVSVFLFVVLAGSGGADADVEDGCSQASPLFDVVLTRAIGGIRGVDHAKAAAPDRADAQASTEHKSYKSYKPFKSAREALTPAEARLLLGGATLGTRERARTGGPTQLNPTGRARVRGGAGAAWARSIALMKRIRAKRKARAKAKSAVAECVTKLRDFHLLRNVAEVMSTARK